jgi:DDE superfamily endonuclease
MEARFAILDRHIILLIDNAACHIIDDPDKYPHIRIHFLPPNTTAHLQPMDAGIIRAFKAHYKKLYLHHVIQEFENGSDSPGHIDVLQAIRIIDRAWHAITMETIANCWRHTAILPRQADEPPRPHEHPLSDDNVNNSELENNHDVPECLRVELLSLEHDIQTSIAEGLANDDNLQASAREYIEDQDKIDTEESLTDQRIIELVSNPSSDEYRMQPNVEDDEDEPKVSFEKAKAHCNEILRFLKQQPASFANENEIDALRSLRKRIHIASAAAKTQRTLHDFFSHE